MKLVVSVPSNEVTKKIVSVKKFFFLYNSHSHSHSFVERGQIHGR